MHIRHTLILLGRHLLSWGALLSCTPLFAMAQCPKEFGAKNAWVNAAGWGVVALALLLGALLLYLAITRSRGYPMGARSITVALGGLGMLVTWFAGVVIALDGFFLQC